jgi:hypothetical protein
MKSKKVLTILLSLAIMVTFMPTFAFAATTPTDAQKDEGHEWDLEEHVEWVIEPTCETPGVGIATCTKEHNGVACTATKNVYQAELNHTRTYEGEGRNRTLKTIVVTAEEYAKEMVNHGYTQAQADSWLRTEGAEICTGTVAVCENCGAYMSTASGSRYDHDLSNPHSFYQFAATTHVAPTGDNAPKPCDATFTCTKCGKTGVSDNTYNATARAEYHANTAHWVQKESYKAHEINGVGYVRVTKSVCDKCGEVVHIVRKYYDSDADEAAGKESTKLGPNSFASMHKTEAVVVAEATCTANGRVENVCTKCGEVVSAEETPKLNHSWKEATTEASEEDYSYKYVQCENCHYYKDADGNAVATWAQAKKDKVALPIKHTVEVTPLLPKNCSDNTWIAVRCTNPVCTLTNHGYTIVDEKAEVDKVGEKYYYTFAAGTDKAETVEVPFEEATGHNWGEAKVIAPETCEDKAIEGRVCDTCGGIYHTTVRETTAALGHIVKEVTEVATCGTAGYTYKICTRCNMYLDQDGKNPEEELYDSYKYNRVDPKVELGAECNFQWTSIDDETDAMKCTVCGAVKEGTQTPKSEDKKIQEATDAAKPVISAAADILNASATYTDDSVKAIEEAKHNLDIAINGGTANQIKNATAALDTAVKAAAPKAENSVTAKGKKVTVKANKKTKKVAKNKTFKKAVKASNAAGKVTFKKANKKGGNKIVVKANGNVVVKKGLKKGTYKVAVTASAAGDGNTLPGTAKATVKVVVK